MTQETGTFPYGDETNFEPFFHSHTFYRDSGVSIMDYFKTDKNLFMTFGYPFDLDFDFDYIIVMSFFV